jgi:hypothetical protein
VDYGASCTKLEWQTLPRTLVDKKNNLFTTYFKIALRHVHLKIALCLKSSRDLAGRRLTIGLQPNLSHPQIYEFDVVVEHQEYIF